ncbi:TlpA disulfide reductase family protein [Nocardioides sp.]|uniref:TlpA family protein disulfide reductase n=1 Tax=Nocardioides sp. TaxID=35761 RepID=UPI002D015430|nr:TlpA disulfide reductase family protein [Nocardioides sp.]HXH81148.1 TlpA disulfide reductase family protein [Nocardioides sp.]
MIRRIALALALVLVLGGCASVRDPQTTPASNVVVDSPALRKAKARTGMVDCRPGTGEGESSEGLPAIDLPCLGGGQTVTMSSLRGPLVINLWQAFCGPCIKEMPVLEEFHQKYGERVGVLGIDYQDVHPEAALELAAKTGVTYPSVADPGGSLNGAGGVPAVRGLPFFLFIDADGKVAHASVGGVDSIEELVDLVEEHLGESVL